jgi:hypothetical protein
VAYLIDTSILARLANTADIQYPVTVQSVMELHRLGEALHVTPQNLVEFRNAATRRVSEFEARPVVRCRAYFSPISTSLAQLSAALAEKIWMNSRGRSAPKLSRRVSVPTAVDNPR